MRRRIVRANVQLVPDPRSPPTSPAPGTAPLSASTSRPAIRSSRSASRCTSSRCTSTADGYVLEDSSAILSRANQALATLERYKLRLDEVTGTLSALEIEDLVTVRDVASVAQRLEMVRRIAREIEGYVVELGTDGRLLSLQLDELIAGVDTDRELVVRDYLPRRPAHVSAGSTSVLDELDGLAAPSSSTSALVAKALGFGAGADVARFLASARAATGCWPRCRGCPGLVVDRLVDHFGGLQTAAGGEHRRPAGGRGRR